MKKTICMVVPNSKVKGGIASVVNGYRGSRLEDDYDIIYVESYVDKNKAQKIVKALAGYIKFMLVLLFRRPDAVHIHSSFGPSFVRKIPFINMAHFARIPIVNHIHGADFTEFYINANDSRKRHIKKIYMKCDEIIALSDEWKGRLALIVPANKITVVENYSIICESAIQERANKRCDNVVLFLGELGHRKGCFDIPDVVELVKRQVPTVLFILAGAGNIEDETKIQQMIKDKGLQNNCLFPGWIRDQEKDKRLRSADIFFLPSYNEGMPMSILDALGYGLPVVSTTVGGIPKIVQDGVNGMCIQPGDVNAFADSIVKILKDDDIRKQFASGSKQIIKQGYSIESHIEKLETIYNRVIR